MPLYEAEIEIPMNLNDGDELHRFIEALREFGHPKIVLRVVAKDKRTAVEEVANSVSVWWGNYRYDREWWARKFHLRQNKNLKAVYPDPKEWS